MNDPPANIIDLRRQLREGFPGAQIGTGEEIGQLPNHQPPPVLPVLGRGHGEEAQNEGQPPPPFAPGGTCPLPQAAISELVAPPGSATSGLALEMLLAGLAGNAAPVVLIDPANAFDPAGVGTAPPRCLHNLLWLRPREPRDTLRAADLSVRDGNFSAVLLDLSPLPAAEAARLIAPPHWYRLRAAAEDSGTALIGLTPAPLVPCAALRPQLSLNTPDLLYATLIPRPLLTRVFTATSQRQRLTCAN